MSNSSIDFINWIAKIEKFVSQFSIELIFFVVFFYFWYLKENFDEFSMLLIDTDRWLETKLEYHANDSTKDSNVLDEERSKRSKFDVDLFPFWKRLSNLRLIFSNNLSNDCDLNPMIPKPEEVSKRTRADRWINCSSYQRWIDVFDCVVIEKKNFQSCPRPSWCDIASTITD